MLDIAHCPRPRPRRHLRLTLALERERRSGAGVDLQYCAFYLSDCLRFDRGIKFRFSSTTSVFRRVESQKAVLPIASSEGVSCESKPWWESSWSGYATSAVHETTELASYDALPSISVVTECLYEYGVLRIDQASAMSRHCISSTKLQE